MAGVLHGCARTTARIRAELQASQESSRALAAPVRTEPQDSREMAQTDGDDGCTDGTEVAEEHGPDTGRRSDCG